MKAKHAPGLREKFIEAIGLLAMYGLIFFGFLVLIRGFAFIRLNFLHTLPEEGWKYMLGGIWYDLNISIWLIGYAFLPFLILNTFFRNLARILLIISAILALIVVLALEHYFASTLLPLGSDLFAYSMAEIEETTKASGNVNLLAFLPIILVIPLGIWAFIYAPKNKTARWIAAGIFFLGYCLQATHLVQKTPQAKDFPSEMDYYLNSNKLGYFVAATEQYFAELTTENEEDLFYLEEAETTVFDPNYPFLHEDQTADVLSPFMSNSPDQETPNVVFIFVESLGKAYSGKDAYLGSFTPFLDSLAEHSLYFQNFLSTAGRTFAILPSALASVPFAKQGFLELGQQMPQHQSIISLLNANGYSSRFFYGGDASFDQMDYFLNRNKVSAIFDKKTFNSTRYQELPKMTNNFTWGYGDKELYRKYFEEMRDVKSPYLSILLTVTSHDPFLIPDAAYYNKRFEERLKELELDDIALSEHRKYQKQYASILYVDDAFKEFFREYAKRPDFKNTVFVITGDHRMPEIPIASQIDRFHVPLLIYSPMLRRSKYIAGVNTQFDLTPSILAFLKSHGLQFPKKAHWMGGTLDTSSAFNTQKTAPLMRNKNELVDYLNKEYFYSQGQVFQVSDHMGIDPLPESELNKDLAGELELFKKRNKEACLQNKLDSKEVMNFKPSALNP